MTRAEQLNQYVTQLEQYVSAHGHLPAANRSTPATNRPRLQQAVDSPHTGEEMKRRLRALLDAPRYGSLRNVVEDPKPGRKQGIAPMLRYLDRLETYLNENGHLPSGAGSASPRTDRARLRRYLDMPALDQSTKGRIEALLASPAPSRTTVQERPEAFDVLPAAAAQLTRAPSAAQQEVLAWIAARRRLPSSVGRDLQERNYYRLLGQIRRSVMGGTATLRSTEFALLIPGLLTSDEQDRACAHAQRKRSEAAERASRKTTVGSLEDRWDKGFEELTAWVETHGSLPRRRTFDADEYRVANWLNVQRMQLRDSNLRPVWKERLSAVPGALEPREQIRDEAELARTVAEFYAQHGRLPKADVPAPEGTVGVRLQKLRSRIINRSIGRDALTILSDIPGATEFRDRKPPLQRLADLEDFVRTTGTFPALNSGGLSNWAYRALRGEGSKRRPEALELRRAVQELRETVPYKVTRKKSGLAGYVTELEGYVSQHGHLPSSTRAADPRFRPERLQATLASPTTDDFLTARITSLLAAKPYKTGRKAA